MSGWIDVNERLPKCSTEPDSFGVQVLVYPPFADDGPDGVTSPIAFYGRRQTREPNFYIYGRVFYPTHWQPIPKPPGKNQ